MFDLSFPWLIPMAMSTPSCRRGLAFGVRPENPAAPIASVPIQTGTLIFTGMRRVLRRIPVVLHMPERRLSQNLRLWW